MSDPVVSDEQVAEIERDLAVQDPEPCDCSWKEPHTNFDCDYEERLWTWVRARDRIAAAAPLLLQALRDTRDEIERLTHLGAVHHADVGEWRAERDTWADRALQAEAERDDWRQEAITRRRTLVNVARGLHLRAGRIQMELNEARAADHDHKLLADEWWRKSVTAEHCLAELAKSAACLDTVGGVLGARLVCIRPSGHTGEHASVAGAHWSLAAPTGQSDFLTTDCIVCDEERRAALSGVDAFSMRMIVCPECGDKRCPKATWHGNACHSVSTGDEETEA